MRQIGELMQELGFNAESSVETQKAFIRHLIAKANGTTPFSKPELSQAPGTQLTFDLNILGVSPKSAKNRR